MTKFEQAIYASKLFKSSTRQDAIRAKISSAENIKLVQQLIGELDEEYHTVNTVVPELKDKIEEKKKELNNQTDDTDDSTVEETLTSHHAGSTPSPSVGAPVSLADDSDNSDVSTENDQAEDTKPDDEKEPVEQSTSVEVIPLDEIKGTLNVSNDTAGVSRIAFKENEMWIYYNDDINLNSIMTDVIERLNTCGYTYLVFNRLARSNNAIIFEIQLNSTNMVGDKIE